MVPYKSNPVLVLFSMLLTPWLVFISSSLSLFILNQNSLDNNIRILTPFFAMMLIGVLIGYAIHSQIEKHRKYLALPWLYFLAGPAFLLSSSLSGVTSNQFNRLALELTILCIWLALGIAFRKVEVTRVFSFLALFSALVISSDVIRAWAQVDAVSAAKVVTHADTNRLEGKSISEAASSISNIYHVILDGYQSDVFEYLNDDRLSRELGGFRNYRENTTIFGATHFSIPSVFLGRKVGVDLSVGELKNQAFNSENSLLGKLQRAGYQTTAYLHQEFDFLPNIFDQVYYHQDFERSHPWSARAFSLVWLNSYWPSYVSRYFLSPLTIEKIESGDLSPDGYPIVSLDAFDHFLSVESDLPSRGRYVFLHLILPHPPYKLTGDCEATSSTMAVEQFQCANLLIVKLVAELKRLNRFEDSLIMIHADHGGNYIIKNGSLEQVRSSQLSLEYNFPRSKALLLFKPFGVSSDAEFTKSDVKSNLLDIAPTITNSIGVGEFEDFEGFSLISDGVPRAQQFYIIGDGKNFIQYLIAEESLVFDKTISVKPTD